MAKMIRTFHPVGQGAFYTEVLKGDDGGCFAVVYDCGTETTAKDMDVNLEQQIDLFAKSVPQIDILFISHFHADHISGLDRLLEKVKVVRTVIPMLDVPTITVTRIQNFIRYNQESALVADGIIRDLYLDGDNTERFGEVVVVAPEDEDEYRAENDGLETLITKGARYFSGSAMSYNVFWEYVPFDSINRDDKRVRDLHKKLKALAAGRMNLNDLLKDHLEDVKKLYREVMNDANDNLYTLVVVSRPKKGMVLSQCTRLAHCVYFGDFDYRQKNKPWGRFNQKIKYADIGTVQVPHHGSKGNWHHEMVLGEPRHYIVSVGSSNRYHHPNYWVLRDIWVGGHRSFVVCERYRTGVRYEFGIK